MTGRKILGQYIKQHYSGEKSGVLYQKSGVLYQKSGVLYQDDDFGQGGFAGSQDEVPAADIVSKRAYQSGTTSLAARLQGQGLGRRVDPFGPVLITQPTAGSPITTYSGGQPSPPASGIPSS